MPMPMCAECWDPFPFDDEDEFCPDCREGRAAHENPDDHEEDPMD